MTRTDAFLVRHAQASFGDEDYDRLSATGFRQAEVLGAALRARVPDVDRIVCGTMRRHRETADACLTAMGVKGEVEEDDGWNEYDHRDVIRAFEPRFADHVVLMEEMLAADHPRKAFQRMFAAAVARWTSGRFDDEYHESWSAFRARVDAALARLHASRDAAARVLVFTSGGPIIAACENVLRLPTEHAVALGWWLANASITRVALDERGPRLVSFNEHGHLAGEHAELLTFR